MFPPQIAFAWSTISPPLILLITAALALAFALSSRDSRGTAGISLVGVAAAAIFNLVIFQDGRLGVVSAGEGLGLLGDLHYAAFGFVILLGTALAIFISYDYLERSGLDQPEYYPLMLLSATGAVVMAGAVNLVIFLLGLEIASLAVYALTAWRQGTAESEEGGMKYFLLGSFASAMLIFGIALSYGATGRFDFAGIAGAVAADGFQAVLTVTMGGLLVLVGMAFKASLVPFHQWAPDAYMGAPTSVTAFMSVVIKAGAFAALLRVAATFLPVLPGVVFELFVWIVALTMIVGNLAALVQRSVKRMLAYSAVAHAGYLGLAAVAPGFGGLQAAMWYLLAYALMSAGAFAVLTLVTDRNDHGDDLDRFAGLARSRPWLAAAMAVFMLSLAGLPPLAGFAGKVMVFGAALAAGQFTLAIVGIITSVVAAFYYFRVVAVMYFRLPEQPGPRFDSAMTGFAVAVAAAGTVLLGLFPGWWHDMLSAGSRLIAGN